MAKVWKEQYDPQKHADRMSGVPAESRPQSSLIRRWVYFVRVCSFTFEFHSIEQVKLCAEYYSQKIHPSSRRDIGGADHWEMMRWYEMLPMYLLEEPKRIRVVKALKAAIEQFAADEVPR